MADFDDPEENFESEATEVDVAKLQKALAQANKEALEARLELRRTQLEKEYGADVVELIPGTLPQTEWKDYAEKLKTFRGEPQAPAQTEVASEETPQAEVAPSEAELKLATVTQGPSGVEPGSGLSPEDAIQLAINDPARYAQMRDSGALELERLPGSKR